ncbi:MAG TPA: MFS transporter, partial [Pseudolabrys sp.]|nr:MFS transporter [Pseudolabrys sp.]
HVVLVGLALMAFGGAGMGMSGSFLSLSSGRLASGIGAVLINVLMTKMVADWFAGREIVTAMALLIASWPLGLALGLLLFAPLAAAYGFGAVMHAGAVLSLLSLLLVALIYRAPADQSAKAAAGLRLTLSGREWLAVCFAGSVWTAYNVGYIVLISFLPGLFERHGWSFAQASRIVSFLGWTLIPSVPLAGYLAERYNWSNLFLVGGFVLAGSAAAVLPFAPNPLVAFTVLVCAIGAPGGLIMALPAQVLRPENRAGGMGIYFTWYYTGMAMLPGLAGVTRDATGSAAAPALFAAAMMMLALAGLIGFRAVMRTAAYKR